MLLQYFHIWLFPHDDICFVKCTSPSCSKTPPHHDAAIPVLHSWDAVLRLTSFSPFSSKCNNGHSGQMTTRVMVSSLLSALSAHVGTGLVSLWIMQLSYQLQPASSQGIFLLFCGSYAHFPPKHIHLWDTEPVSFLNGLMAGHSYDVHTCV